MTPTAGEQLRNPRTIGTCRTPKTPTDTRVLCGAEARLFPGGWFCAEHRPGPRQLVRHLKVVR